MSFPSCLALPGVFFCADARPDVGSSAEGWKAAWAREGGTAGSISAVPIRSAARLGSNKHSSGSVPQVADLSDKAGIPVQMCPAASSETCCPMEIILVSHELLKLKVKSA